MAKQTPARQQTPNREQTPAPEQSAFSQFGDAAIERIESNPLMALAGGLAIGALIAALLRQGEKEGDLLRPAGTRISDAGRTAVDRARDVSKAKFDELAGDKVREYFGIGTAPEAR